MGYDATRFVVGDEWVYRLRDDAASERVRILAVMPKKSSARLDVVFLDDPDGRVENVPGSRLPVLWSKVEAYDVLMANWARLDKVKLDDVESSCASLVFEVLIPEDIAAIGWSTVDDATSIHAATKLEEIIGVPVADIVTRVESFTLNEATVVSPAGTVLIAEAACRANPAQILDEVVEEEAEDRYKCKNGSSRVGLISREKEPTSPEWEYHMYRQVSPTPTRAAAPMVWASRSHFPRAAPSGRSRKPATRRAGRRPDQASRSGWRSVHGGSLCRGA
jgi:hypothetical protein